ncbi:MAG: PLP-dependent aminotransferase family protein [Hyphomonadaceae bacterium]|nr:PLP-dependent aminotransferase family protein [Clostridia bacterium]
MGATHLFSNKVKNLQGSAIREILKLTQQSDIISFAGGLPAPEMFPEKELAALSQDILLNRGHVALQYGITEGYAPLIETVKKRLATFGIGKDYDQVAIVSGAQQGIDLAAKVFLNEGDGIVCENPSFIGSLNGFRAYNANLIPVTMQADGMDVQALEQILKTTPNVKLIYTIPTFQNPTGITMSLAKRQRLLQLAEQYNVYIIEDNPYGELRFAGEDLPTIKQLDQTGRVIYVGSFSKILAPGLRLGWAMAREEILAKMVVCKQVSDVHSNLFAQMLADEYLKQYDITTHIQGIRALYGERCGLMLACMDEHFPKSVTYTRPEGGLFIWCTLPEGMNSIDVMKACVAKKVAFVPGSTFMVDQDAPCNCFRLNYSSMAEEKIRSGIAIMGEVLRGVCNG